jgi:hypothetical protein
MRISPARSNCAGVELDRHAAGGLRHREVEQCGVLAISFSSVGNALHSLRIFRSDARAACQAAVVPDLGKEPMAAYAVDSV